MGDRRLKIFFCKARHFHQVTAESDLKRFISMDRN
jgi:hypothetical protein